MTTTAGRTDRLGGRGSGRPGQVVAAARAIAFFSGPVGLGVKIVFLAIVNAIAVWAASSSRGREVDRAARLHRDDARDRRRST